MYRKYPEFQMSNKLKTWGKNAQGKINLHEILELSFTAINLKIIVVYLFLFFNQNQ